MFEQTSRLAEKLAASVSRRGFLGSLGGWAAAAAFSVAGVLTVPRSARSNSHSGMCCTYDCGCGALDRLHSFFFEGATVCPLSCFGYGSLASGQFVSNCTVCKKSAPRFISCNGCPS
jgi:hypothetical protein